MGKFNFGVLIKCIIFGVVWALILSLVGLCIKNFTNYSFKDILFLEGLIVILLSGMALVSGGSMGESFKILGEMNTERPNLELKRFEDEKTKNIFKRTLSIERNSLSIIIGAFICFIISFVMPV
ncbi:hypothetical protein SAMN02745163_01049 [Clostridium cavendishii DSM 21758]|uniref:Uncharacterized protein n=1 Tax=Clostridium cavendishii DSM 21758 TaxID=1121302 RepID=A0A1M6F6F0_9CLOT|nr:hypothetical protein [Clostridium cavendishii]SHI93298.1 hypothetical protein SAMN02745163_01049 [Clostridium cavendishii DSM 21758]